MAYLLVTKGAQTGERYPLTAGEYLIGRNPTCDINLTDSSVSRQHAKIRALADGTFVVEDANSSYGTLVNRQKVTKAALLDKGRGKARGIEVSAIEGCQIHRTRDDVGCGKSFLNGDVLHMGESLDDIDAQDIHPQASTDVGDLDANAPDANDEESAVAAFPAGKTVAVEVAEVVQLDGQAPHQRGPEQHGLLGHCPSAVLGQIACGQRGGVSLEITADMVEPRTARQDTADSRSPIGRDLRLGSDADQGCLRMAIGLFLNRAVGEGGFDAGGQIMPEGFLLLVERFVKGDVIHGRVLRAHNRPVASYGK